MSGATAERLLENDEVNTGCKWSIPNIAFIIILLIIIVILTLKNYNVI
jgi:hypothetical protein